jgi:hypothetical protein
MYGCDPAVLKCAFEGSLHPMIYVMGILSDVQEVISHGDVETGRQFCNRAKFLLAEYYLDQQRPATPSNTQQHEDETTA